MRCLCAAVHRSALLAFAACGLALAVAPRAYAQAQLADPEILWAVGYPRIEGGKVLFRGSVKLPNGYHIPTGSVSIHVFPMNGGLGFMKLCSLDQCHNFSGSLSLKDFPVPTREYATFSMVHVISGDGRAEVTLATRVMTLSIP